MIWEPLPAGIGESLCKLVAISQKSPSVAGFKMRRRPLQPIFPISGNEHAFDTPLSV